MYRERNENNMFAVPASRKPASAEAEMGPRPSLAIAEAAAPRLLKSDTRGRGDRPSPNERPEAETGTPPASPVADGSQAAPAAAGNHRRRRLLVAIAAALAVGAAGWYGDHWLTVGRFIVSTDDAYVRAHNTTLAAKVSGYLASVEVEDNSFVHAGDVIARIDDGDFVLAVDSARDKVATQQAAVERIGRQIVAQQANVEQTKAQLASAQAARTQTASEYERQQALASKEFASRQTLEKVLAARDQAVAGVDSARAALEAAQANVDVLKAQQQEAARTLDELKTALAKAERDLSFTVIRAPIDAALGNRAVQTGDYVQPGQRLASLVPLDEVYIDANFKETQLARLQPGQSVDISIDALPGDTVHGTIDSVSPASGSVFSLLPPDNATGNFTKIVQRLPVRIRVPAEVAKQQVLRPGMSVVVSVNTKSQAATANSAASGTTAPRLLAAQR
jgi:membrane fusion protein, multidrug efflux system